MNDDAKYFFFLSGFVGFVFFFSFSLFLYHDPLRSILYGSIGSLFFSLSWRMLLMSALKKVQCSKENEPNKMSKPQVLPAPQPVDRKNREAIKSAMKANIEASSQKKLEPALSQSLNQ
jgi:hypothetical protein